MLAHISIRVSDLERSKAFYDEALAPLGMEIVLKNDGVFYGWGTGDNVEFEICIAEDADPPHKRVHVAFRVKDKAMVDAFYAAALKAGATDNGAPGLRPDYTDTYYAAFVRDPDENNIEVCFYE